MPRCRPSLCFLESPAPSVAESELPTLPFLPPRTEGRSEEYDPSPPPPAGDDDGGARPVRHRCMNLLKHGRISGEGGGLSAAYGRWRSAQSPAATTRAEKQLQVRWALEDQVEAHLGKLEAHYSRPIAPRDVAHILSPEELPAMEIAGVYWLGGWRPSAILSEVPRLVGGGGASPEGLDRRCRRFLSVAVRRFKVEEAVLDEEMAEISSMWVLSLLGPAGAGEDGGERAAPAAVVGELGKVVRVVERAQQLRYGAVELAVRRALDAAQAAEFLVGFSGMQLALHRMGTAWKSHVGPLHLALHQSTPTPD